MKIVSSRTTGNLNKNTYLDFRVYARSDCDLKVIFEGWDWYTLTRISELPGQRFIIGSFLSSFLNILYPSVHIFFFFYNNPSIIRDLMSNFVQFSIL